MNEVITIGVDLAKNVFQVHGVDAEGGPHDLDRDGLDRRAAGALGLLVGTRSAGSATGDPGAAGLASRPRAPDRGGDERPSRRIALY